MFTLSLSGEKLRKVKHLGMKSSFNDHYINGYIFVHHIQYLKNIVHALFDISLIEVNSMFPVVLIIV